MSDKPSPERPIRVGVFENVEQADAAVSDLLAAGFTKEEITVICSARSCSGTSRLSSTRIRRGRTPSERWLSAA